MCVYDFKHRFYSNVTLDTNRFVIYEHKAYLKLFYFKLFLFYYKAYDFFWKIKMDSEVYKLLASAEQEKGSLR